jgi:hypothetical protein
MAGAPKTVAGPAAAPCKIIESDDEFQINAGALPVPVLIESDPVTCGFTMAHIEVFDAAHNLVDSSDPNATTANLPPTLGGLAAGTYDVIINISPAVGAKPGNPFNGGEARLFENCKDKTELFLADETTPTPQFTLVVK